MLSGCGVIWLSLSLLDEYKGEAAWVLLTNNQGNPFGVSKSHETSLLSLKLICCSVQRRWNKHLTQLIRTISRHILFACSVIIRCCCSAFNILLLCFNKALSVSLQKDSGQGDALPKAVFALQPLPLPLLQGDANLAVLYFLPFCPYVTIVCLIATISHSYCTLGKRSQKSIWG